MLSAALEPGTRPPMSVWWQITTVQARISAPAKTGKNMKMSGRCMPPEYGSFMITASPGARRPFQRAFTASIASGIAPRCWAMVLACATISPRASQIAAE